jgi:hypothetical protein
VLVDLRRQLARRREHQRARGSARPVHQPVQDREQEGGGLAAAGHRAGEQVAALHGGGDRLFLDGRGTGEAERPGAAVAGLLADVATESLVAEAKSDPLAVAIAASARRRRELLAEAGGGLSTAMVARALGTSRQAVDKRRRTGTLLAVPMPAGDWAFPAAQFGPDQRPLEGLADALRAFSIDDPWMRLAELLAPDADLGGRSVFQTLREEGRAALPQVCRALAGVAEHGA